MNGNNEKDREEDRSGLVPDAAPGGEEDHETDNGKDDPGKKRDLFAEFLRSRAVLIVSIAALLIPIVLLLIAVFLGGTVFDKVAVVWACLAAVQFAYWYKLGRRVSHLVMTNVSGVFTLAFVALYVLELPGVI